MGPGFTGSTRCAWKMRRGASRKSAERRIVVVFCARAEVKNASGNSNNRRLFRATLTISILVDVGHANAVPEKAIITLLRRRCACQNRQQPYSATWMERKESAKRRASLGIWRRIVVLADRNLLAIFQRIGRIDHD